MLLFCYVLLREYVLYIQVWNVRADMAAIIFTAYIFGLFLQLLYTFIHIHFIIWIYENVYRHGLLDFWIFDQGVSEELLYLGILLDYWRTFRLTLD